MPVEFQLLGPLMVLKDDRSLDLPGAKPRALLAALLLHADRVVSTDQLIDALWAETPPERAANAVQVYVSNLRKLVGSDRIVTTPPGYRIAVAPSELDVTRFEQLVEAAAAARRRDDLVAALSLLREALSLWRGPALAGFEFADFAAVEAARLEELRIVAIEDRIDVELSLGAHDSLIGELESLVAAHPLRERLRGLEMLSLYRANRQADALRAFQHLRRVLGEELGIEPSRELARLEEAILLQKEHLDWRPAGAPESDPSRWALPAALAGDDVPFVDREHERAQLRESWARAVGGATQVTLVSGDAGIGKSRLVTELARTAAGEGAIALHGACDEEHRLPFGPFIDALRHLVVTAPIDELRVEVGSGAGDLARIVPEIRQLLGAVAPTPADADTQRYYLFQAVAAFLERASRRAPLLVVLEDLQWADRPTLLMLRHVLRTLSGAPILVVGTYRDRDLEPSHPLVEFRADVVRQHAIERIRLRGLPPDSVAALVEQLGRGDLAADPAELQQRTGGNPFFLLELVRRMSGAATGDDPPESVRDVVLSRVRALGATTGRMLSTAAVIGRQFSVDLLSRVSDLSLDEMVDGLEEAEAKGIIVEGAATAHEYRFAHALIADTLAGDLSETRRRLLHARIGETLEAQTLRRAIPPYAELARHFIQARSAETLDKALDYSIRAAERAASVLAYEDAAEHYRDALRLMEIDGIPDQRRYCELLLALGDSRIKSGAIDDARHVYVEAAERARRIDAADLLAGAAIGILGPPARFLQLPDPVVIDALEQAAAALRDGDQALRAIVLGALALRLPDGAPRRREVTADACEIASALDDPDVSVAALKAKFWDLYVDGTPAERLEVTDALAQLVGNERSERRLEIHILRMTPFLELGRIDEFDRELAAAADLADALDMPIYRAIVTSRTALREMLRAHFDEAERLADESLALFGEDPGGVHLYAIQLFVLRRDQGRLDEIKEVIQEVGHEHPAWELAACLLALETGRRDQARQQLDALAADDFASVPQRGDQERAMSLALLAIVVAAFEHEAYAARVYELLARYSGETVVVGQAACYGAIDRFLGMLATVLRRWDDAEHHFTAALELDERLGAPHLVAYTTNAWERMRSARAAATA